MAAKRLVDLIGSGAGLILLAPVMLIVALVVRWGIGSPILFRQERAGFLGQPFQVLKFRSMSDARDPTGALLPDDRRLTGLGRWLRSTSLDELPALVNVLRGEMSLVGPRPLLLDYLPHYSIRQARRHEVLPGITGWAAVQGRNALAWERRLELDVWYVDHQSLGLDLKILLLTLVKVLKREGISADGHATMPRFDEAAGGACRRGDPGVWEARR